MIDHEIDVYIKLETLIIENGNVFSQNHGIPTAREVRAHIEMLEVSKMFGIDNLEHRGHKFYKVSQCRITDVFITWFGEGVERSISWSDDGRQPKDEWLMTVTFPTGAYIFGRAYPEDAFNKFFCELKDFGPKYSDTVNKALYFDTSMAAEVVSELPVLFEKYRKMARLEVVINEEKELKQRLEKIQREIEEP